MSYYLVILLAILQIQHGVYSFEFTNAENNKNDITPPIYETIIFGDVADILNEFDNTNSPLEAMISGSESEENMEDLLTEYQRYLDKAHQQKIEFLEKNKVNAKNKVPLIRHERYMKNKPTQAAKYDNVHYNAGYYNYNQNILQSDFRSPLDILLPPSPKASSPLDIFFPASHKFQGSKFIKKDIPPLRSKEDEEIITFGKHTNDFFSGGHQRSDQSKTPSRKPCKICMMMSHDAMSPTYTLHNQLQPDNSESMNEQNTLNIRVKVDIQLPKALDNLSNGVNNRSREDEGDSKETSQNVPFPYLNFPIPMNLFGFKKSSASKYYKHDLGHHKKKKSRMSNYKKHKKNIKYPWFNMNASQLFEPESFKESPHFEETLNFIDLLKKDNDSYQQVNESTPVNTEKTESRLNETDVVDRKIETKTENSVMNDTTTTENNIYIMVNISSITGNVTDEQHKDNSIETDYTTMKSNNMNNKENSMVSKRVRRQLSTIEPLTILAVATTAHVDIVKQTNSTESKTNGTKIRELESAQTIDIKQSKTVTPESKVTPVPVDTVDQTEADSASSKQDTNTGELTLSQKVKRHLTTIKPVTISTAATGVHIDALNQADVRSVATVASVNKVKETGDVKVRNKRQTNLNETKILEQESLKATDAKSEKAVPVDKEATTASIDIVPSTASKQITVVKPIETVGTRRKRQTKETKVQEMESVNVTDTKSDKDVPGDKEATTVSVDKGTQTDAVGVNNTPKNELESVKATNLSKSDSVLLVEEVTKIPVDKKMPTLSVGTRTKRQTNETNSLELKSVNVLDEKKIEKVGSGDIKATTVSVDAVKQTDAVKANSQPHTNEHKSVTAIDVKISEKALPIGEEATKVPDDVVKPTDTVQARTKRQTNETKMQEIESVKVTDANKSEKVVSIDKEATTVSVDIVTQTDSNPTTEIKPTKTVGARRKRQANETKMQEMESVNVKDINKSEKVLSVNKEATKVPAAAVKQTAAIEMKSEPNISEEITEVESVKVMDLKKSEKVLLVDNELKYWPESTHKTVVASTPHNITTIIVERENQKAKLNLTKETIRNNHTKVLEKAIFGDVNWDDMDTVAPVFMSFVGKYMNGVLTFCSSNICHSMKCAEQACVHRICKPEERWNQRGHCEGSNNTDSVASMQSIMDLPSNVAFEIVDILEEKMLGKMYGSVTLCITSKCVSFVTSKRNFRKSKCSLKEFNNAGQCPISKKTKLT